MTPASDKGGKIKRAIADLEKRNKELEEHNKALTGVRFSEKMWPALTQKLEGLKQRNKLLEESKCTQVMLDEVKKLFEEMKESRDAYRDMLKGHFFKTRECSKEEYEKVSGCKVKQEWNINYRVHETDWKAIDTEAQRIIAEKKGTK